MIDFNQLLSLLNQHDIIAFFFKTFSIFFSLFYLLYAIIISKQTQVMNQALESDNNAIFFTIASIQITAGLILIILAIFLI